MTAKDIELALARYLDIRRWLIVPNVSWGRGLDHECDLVAVSKKGWAHEIEIKVSVADVKRDLKKWHGHRSSKLAALWFAIPDELVSKALPHIPERAGVYAVTDDEGSFRVKEIRRPRRNHIARQLTETDLAALGRLGTLRYWSQRSRTLAW